MAELDVEKLKQRYARFLNALTVTITRADFDAIIVALDDGKLHRFLLDKALEDRERLRAAGERLRDQAESREEFNSRGDRAGWYEVPDREFIDLCAALEGRDG